MHNNLKELLEYYGLYVYENKIYNAYEIAESPDSLTFIKYYHETQEIVMYDYRNASKDSLLKAMTVINLFNSTNIYM